MVLALRFADFLALHLFLQIRRRRRPWPPIAIRGRSSYPWPPIAARGRPSLPVATRRRPWPPVAARGGPSPVVASLCFCGFLDF